MSSTEYALQLNEAELPGPAARQYLARDKAVISPSYPRAYPFVMDHGEGSLVWDVDGNRFIDFHAGIAVCATGHAHPDVIHAIQRQVERFLHISPDFYHPAMIELAERLTQITPGEFEKQVFFTNSGTEAVEGALKLARYHTGRSHVLAFVGSFHGRTMGSLSLTGSKPIYRRRFGPFLPGITHVPYGYCYRCPINLTYPQCDIACVDYIEDVVFDRTVSPDEVAAIFVEPIQGEGGYIVPPPGWHQRLRALCDRHNILFVADEVQSGMGRTGKWFAIEHWGVAPDIVCIGKGIASGMPMGAIVARKELMTWESGSHGNTFGGNPVAAVAALETIRLIEEDYMAHAARMGEHILSRLREMQRRHRSIGDVRGLGLMIGVEFVDRDGRPNPSLRDDILMRAFRQGLLLLGAGLSAIRISPALNIPQEVADEGLDIFEACIAQA